MCTRDTRGSTLVRPKLLRRERFCRASLRRDSHQLTRGRLNCQLRDSINNATWRAYHRVESRDPRFINARESADENLARAGFIELPAAKCSVRFRANLSKEEKRERGKERERKTERERRGNEEERKTDRKREHSKIANKNIKINTTALRD